MRRVLFAVVVLALQSASAAQSTAVRPQPADAVVRLLEDLEKALRRGRAEDLRALASDFAARRRRGLSLARTVAGGPATGAVVRERATTFGGRWLRSARRRARQPRAGGTHRDVAPRGPAAWNVVRTIRARRRSPKSPRSTACCALNLDTTKQFAVKNLSLELTDLSLKMDSGVAYVAESENGVTAMVLRGKGEVVFSPSDPAEQAQLRLFNGGRSPLAAPIDSAFLPIESG